MAVLDLPWFTQSGAHGAAEVRRANKLAFPHSGVAGPSDLLVSVVSGRTVAVAAGSCSIVGTQSPVSQGAYSGMTNDASFQLTLPAADPTLARNDLIIARVNDPAYPATPSGDPPTWAITSATGVPAASPADPAPPADSLVLCRVAVAAAPTGDSLVAGNLQDRRPMLGPELQYVEGTANGTTGTGLHDSGLSITFVPPLLAPGEVILLSAQVYFVSAGTATYLLITRADNTILTRVFLEGNATGGTISCRKTNSELPAGVPITVKLRTDVLPVSTSHAVQWATDSRHWLRASVG